MAMKVVELFAGVGGFRIGFERASSTEFEFVFANQWEPSTKVQHAYDCYVKNFGVSEKHSNKDIAIAKNEIPNHDILVGGFPCQDYSVARSLSNEKGIEGKKGVLWWEIDAIVKKHKPKFILLENVDRLLKSPSKARGRDFGIMLYTLYQSDYSVEWRVINAADYGHPQQRRRIFIFAAHKSTKYYKQLQKSEIYAPEWLSEKSLFAENFKSEITERFSEFDIKKYTDLLELQDKFTHHFWNAGIMFNGKGVTAQLLPTYVGHKKILKEILEKKADDSLYLNEYQMQKMAYLKSSKKISRTSKTGATYNYSEGAMQFPDVLNKPGRTMLTSEKSINRSTHVVKDKKGLRFLSPVECERMNEFPDNWTNTGMPASKRYFCMGNAVVIGVIEKIVNSMIKYLK